MTNDAFFVPSGTVPLARRLNDVLTPTASALSAVAVVGTAFLYLAGEAYIDTYLRGFGIFFGASSTSTAHVLSQGYTVVFFALIEHLPGWTVFLAIVSCIGCAVGLALGLGTKRQWPLLGTAAAGLESFDARYPNFSRNLLLFALSVAVLCGARPAGEFAAGRERAYTLEKVKNGCCFVYSVPGRSVRGFPIAQDSNLIWLLSKDGLIALPQQNLSVRLPVGNTTGKGARK